MVGLRAWDGSNLTLTLTRNKFVLIFDGLVWLGILKDISATRTWINVLFAELKPCCQIGSFYYEVDDKFVLTPRRALSDING